MCMRSQRQYFADAIGLGKLIFANIKWLGNFQTNLTYVRVAFVKTSNNTEYQKNYPEDLNIYSNIYVYIYVGDSIKKKPFTKGVSNMLHIFLEN